MFVRYVRLNRRPRRPGPVEPTPVSMAATVPFEDAAAAVLTRSFDKTRFLGGKDFEYDSFGSCYDDCVLTVLSQCNRPWSEVPVAFAA